MLTILVTVSQPRLTVASCFTLSKRYSDAPHRLIMSVSLNDNVFKPESCLLKCCGSGSYFLLLLLHLVI